MERIAGGRQGGTCQLLLLGSTPSVSPSTTHSQPNRTGEQPIPPTNISQLLGTMSVCSKFQVPLFCLFLFCFCCCLLPSPLPRCRIQVTIIKCCQIVFVIRGLNIIVSVCFCFSFCFSFRWIDACLLLGLD